MKRSRYAAVILAIALAMTTAAPSAAIAYTPMPAPITQCPPRTVSSSFNTCTFVATVTAWQQATTLVYPMFVAFESVKFSLTGRGALSGALAMAGPRTAETISITKTADASGAASVTFTLPPTASGKYTLTAVGDVTGQVPDVTIDAPAASGTLPATGQDTANLTPAWVGGGILVVGGLLMTTMMARRRQS